MVTNTVGRLRDPAALELDLIVERAPTFCGPPGGRCLGLDGGAVQCFQACIPDQCVDLCAEGEVCVALTDPNDNPVPFDTNDPSSPALGACIEPPTGDQGAYDECGVVGACQAGLACIDLTEIEGASFCSPGCSAQNNTCPSRKGTAAQCVLGADVENPTNCALLCDAADAGTPTGCPAGMTCTATGQTAGICLFPEN